MMDRRRFLLTSLAGALATPLVSEAPRLVHGRRAGTPARRLTQPSDGLAAGAIVCASSGLNGRSARL
jgi:hypothetical protein